MKIKDAARMFAKELGIDENCDEAEMFCSSIMPGAGDVELNEAEVELARPIFHKVMKQYRAGQIENAADRIILNN
jgi:hypothetical protein